MPSKQQATAAERPAAGQCRLPSWLRRKLAKQRAAQQEQQAEEQSAQEEGQPPATPAQALPATAAGSGAGQGAATAAQQQQCAPDDCDQHLPATPNSEVEPWEAPATQVCTSRWGEGGGMVARRNIAAKVCCVIVARW